jgi:ankyrin repeat protein
LLWRWCYGALPPSRCSRDHWPLQNLEIVRLLLEEAADPNLADLMGRTPLMLAAGK